jgi:hypothetical protein
MRYHGTVVHEEAVLPDLLLYSLTAPRVLGDPHDRAAADRGRPDPFRLAMLRGGGPPPA